jgi:PAS domain S-box-containing protein
MQRFLPATYRTLLLVSVLVVVSFLVLVLFQNLKSSDESNKMVERTYNVLLQSDRLAILLSDCEVGSLRFLIRATDKLTPYNACLSDLPATRAELRRLTSDNPNQQMRLNQLDDLISRRLQVLAERIEIRRTKGASAAQAQLNSDGGLIIGRQIRTLLAEMSNEEQRLLSQRKAVAAALARRTLRLTMVGSFLLIALLSCINFILERDVISRRRAEEEVSRREILFRGMFDNASVGIALLSPEGRFQLMNTRFAEITGYTQDQLSERTVQSITLNRNSSGSDLLRELTENRKQRWLRGDGTSIWVRMTASALPSAEGVGERFICIIEDINAQVQAEAALQSANLSLLRSNESLHEFAYVASHDMKEPLRTISMFSDLLVREAKPSMDERAAKFVGIIQDSARRMSKLIEALLAYAQASADDKAAFQNVNMHDLLNETLDSLRGRIEEEQAVVRCHPLPIVYADPIRLNQVLQNLIGNALKYRRPGVPPEIEVDCEKRPEEWVVSVKDNGMGFQPQFSERIFGIFKRLHSQEISGAGVGLAVVKTVVQGHGGRVWAESAGENKGSTFTFTIPINGHGEPA